MLKIQDGFNEKNLNKHNINNKTNLNLSFTGHKVIQDENGDTFYRFYLPNLKDGQKASVKIVKLIKDDKGNYQTVKNDNEIVIKEYKFKEGENFIDRHFESHGLSKNSDVTLGYKFIINDKDYKDSTLLTSDREWNIATPPNRPLLEEARPMYHMVPDFMISKKAEKENASINDQNRTHFNKLGGNIDGIMGTDSDGKIDCSRLDYIKNLGAKRILSTPIFGQDNLSSHGYWTTNPYQVTDGLGDISKFKKLNTELFKRGMGWIADGAFVNEGLEGMHTEHINKWGTQSPYIDWLNTFSFPDKPFKFGILSKKEDIKNENIGIRLINANYKLHIDENGEENWEPNKRDSSKPTYVQLYDKRLASAEQVNNDELIRDYKNKNSADPNEINDYMDSIIPYGFKINPKEVSQKFRNWKESEKIEEKQNKEIPPFKNFLTEWTNFAVNPSDSDGGSTLWVGNKDISKLRFMLTEQDKKDIKFSYGNKAEEKINKVEQSINQVQDNIVQVGEFWTNEVAKTLHSHTAKQLSGAITADQFKTLIDKGVKSNELPESASQITENHIENILDGTYSLKTAPSPENVTDGLMSYPLNAIEFDSGMSGILGSPFLKKLASTEDQIGKSRYEVYKTQQSKDYADIPEEFRPVYKEMDNLISEQMTKTAVEILKEVQKINKTKISLPIFEEGTKDLTENGKELYSLVSNDMTKFIVTQGLLKEAKANSHDLFGKDNLSPKYENKENLEYDTALLKKVSPQSLCINGTTPAQEAEITISRLSSGIESITPAEKKAFAQHIAGRLKNLNENNIKVAKMLVDKTESGLEWRIDAAKDVCPVEEINEDKVDFESSWDKGIKFWEKFTSGVRKYNPRAYEILEVTDEAGLAGANKAPEKYKNAHESMLKFIQGPGATTASNYNYLYSGPQKLYGQFTEAGERGHNDNAHWLLREKLLQGWCAGQPNHAKGMLESGSLDTINHSHNFIGNHDKPRYAHLAGLDAETFYNKSKQEAMKDALDASFNLALNEIKAPETAKTVIKKATERLASGEYHSIENGKIVEKQYNPDFFGARAYDRNINDVLKESKLVLEEKNKTETPEYKFLTDKTNVDSLKKKTFEHMIKPALKRYEAIVGLLVGMPGNPTIYAGDEIGETGWENKNKNTYVQNRNPIHYDRIDSMDGIKQTKDKIQKLMNLKTDERCSPLKNGMTVFVADNNTNNKHIAALYRYNDKKDMFILFTNDSFGSDRNNIGGDGTKTINSIDKIDLTEEIALNKDKNTTDNNPQNVKSIMDELPAGTKYRNALEENPNIYYEIRENKTTKAKYLQKIENGEKKSIEMKDPYLFLYRENNFDNTPNDKKVAFSGNPHVALQNTKYNIPKK